MIILKVALILLKLKIDKSLQVNKALIVVSNNNSIEQDHPFKKVQARSSIVQVLVLEVIERIEFRTKITQILLLVIQMKKFNLIHPLMLQRMLIARIAYLQAIIN